MVGYVGLVPPGPAEAAGSGCGGGWQIPGRGGDARLEIRGHPLAPGGHSGFAAWRLIHQRKHGPAYPRRHIGVYPKAVDQSGEHPVYQAGHVVSGVGGIPLPPELLPEAPGAAGGKAQSKETQYGGAVRGYMVQRVRG